MKKILLIVFIVILSFTLSACSVVDSYFTKSYNKVLINDGYEYFESVDNLNLKLQNYIYKWQKNGDVIISPFGSCIIENEEDFMIYTPNAFKIIVFKNNDCILKYNFEDKDYYIKKDLNVYVDEVKDSNNLIEVYEYDSGYMFIYDNTYAYFIDNENNIYVNEEYNEKFTFFDNTITIDCKDIMKEVNNENIKTYFISSFFSNNGYYVKELDDSIKYYQAYLDPNNFILDLQSSGFTVTLVDQSYMGNSDYNKVWYAISKDENVIVRISYEVLGREDAIMSVANIYDNRYKKAMYGSITTDNDWKSDVKETMDESLNFEIPFYCMGSFYSMTKDMQSNGANKDFTSLVEDCYEIYDMYYKPILNEYKKVLIENGFTYYELPITLKQGEDENYTEWRTKFNFWASSIDAKYFDTYINEEKNVFIKLTYSIEKGNIIQIYKND